ncbi:hypothetical protein [Jatrophihabitans sp.]|uniref:hypothetical protein n=1 Tax=Jatrophihabitans sp. TaxID=1932789 RepID=UPI0038CDC8F7
MGGDITLLAGCFSINGEIGDVCGRISHIQSPTDLVTSGLIGLFGPGLIVCGFALFNVVSSWVGIARISLRTGRSLGRSVITASASVRLMSARFFAIGLALSAFVLAMQLAWVGMGYYVGNSISVIFNSNEQDTLPHLDQIPGMLTWDAFSKGFILANAVGLAFAYSRRPRNDYEGISATLALPGYFYGFCGLVGGALNLVMLALGSPVEGVDATAITYMFTLGVAGVFYVLATTATFRACAWMKRFWRYQMLAA